MKKAILKGKITDIFTRITTLYVQLEDEEDTIHEITVNWEAGKGLQVGDLVEVVAGGG